MPVQPVRPAGSYQRLRFVGDFAVGEALAAFPKTQSSYSSNTTTIGGVAYREIRLLLTDNTSANTIGGTVSTMPNFVYDDAQPADSQPSAPTAGLGLTVDGLNVTEQKITQRTWCQNLLPRLQAQSAATAAQVTSFANALTQVVIDGPNSGLGGNTGLPVVVLFCELANPTTLGLCIDVEVRHTGTR